MEFVNWRAPEPLTKAQVLAFTLGATMFADACKLFRQSLCIAGTAEGRDIGNYGGTGCLFSPRHIITAAHVVDGHGKNGRFAVVSKFDGVSQCDVVFESSEWDVAVLEAKEVLTASDGESPTSFPQFSKQSIQQGDLIGFFSLLRKQSPANSYLSSFQHFPAGFASFLGEDEHGTPRWILDHGFIEAGFSGSPAFRADGSYVGLIVATTAMSQIVGGNVPSILHSLPQLSIVPRLPADLASAINDSRNS